MACSSSSSSAFEMVVSLTLAADGRTASPQAEVTSANRASTASERRGRRFTGVRAYGPPPFCEHQPVSRTGGCSPNGGGVLGGDRRQEVADVLRGVGVAGQGQDDLPEILLVDGLRVEA